MNFFFYILCIIVFLFKTQTVFSENSVYDVNNVEVSSKINNNLDKKKLIQSSFQKAFIIFVNKTLLKKDAMSLYKTKISSIEDLVFSYQIVEEEKKNNREQIIVTNIKFDQKKITNFFALKGISYADVENISLTLLPIFIKNRDVFMYADNFFYNNWLNSKDEKKNSDDTLISYSLGLEDIEDLRYINLNKDNLESIDVKKITSLNNIKNYAILIIYFTEGKFRAYIKTNIKNKEVDKNIELKVYPNNEIRTYEEALVTLKDEIIQIWKSQNLIDIRTPSFLDLFLNVKKIDDYLKLRSIFDSIDLIEYYSVSMMTSEYVKIRLKYKGKLNKLNNKLLEKKIKIKIVNNIWKIKVN